MVCKIGFTKCNAKIALLRGSMVLTSCIKLFQTGADRHDGILLSLLLLVAETNTNDFITVIHLEGNVFCVRGLYFVINS